MRIAFTRDKDGGERHIMRMERSDGTATWTATTPFFMEHDLLHYAVETILGYRSAFWGMIDQGWEVSSFEERQPGTRKAVQLPEEAYRAECLVGMLTVDHTEGHFTFAEFQHLMLETYGMENLVTDSELTWIRTTWRDLVDRWLETPEGATLELSFDR